jgi:hypothetical protein
VGKEIRLEIDLALEKAKAAATQAGQAAIAA